MRRGFFMTLEGMDIPTTIAIGELADAAGFDALFMPEFFNFNPYVRLALLAPRTRRITLATGIAYAFARAPLVNAAAILDLDEASGGRALLGLGTGTKRVNQDWFGAPFERPVGRMKEVVQAVRTIVAAGPESAVRFEGEFYDLSIPRYSRLAQARPSVPIYTAGVNRQMIALAGQVADGLVAHPFTSRRYLQEVLRPQLAAGAGRAGRAVSEIDHVQYLITAIGDDPDLARRDARLQIAFYATVKTYDPILDLHGWQDEKVAIRAAFARGDLDALASAVSDEMLDQMAVAGTPAQVLRQLAAYDGLMDMLVVYPPSFGVPAGRVRGYYETAARTLS